MKNIVNWVIGHVDLIKSRWHFKDLISYRRTLRSIRDGYCVILYDADIPAGDGILTTVLTASFKDRDIAGKALSGNNNTLLLEDYGFFTIKASIVRDTDIFTPVPLRTKETDIKEPVKDLEKKCFCCNGTGKVFTVFIWTPCSCCNGTGLD